MAYSRSRRDDRGDLQFSAVAMLRLVLVVFGLAVVVVSLLIYVAPLAGHSWTDGLDEIRCLTPGLCSADPPPAFGGGLGSRVEFRSVGALLQCERADPDGCADVRSGGDVLVPVVLIDAAVDHVGLLAMGARGDGLLRYVALRGLDDGSAGGWLMCAYGRSSPSALALAEGDEILATTTLWRDDGEIEFSTVTPVGEPGCRVHLVNGAPPLWEMVR